jgi:hypothetical protein
MAKPAPPEPAVLARLEELARLLTASGLPGQAEKARRAAALAGTDPEAAAALVSEAAADVTAAAPPARQVR